LPENNSFFLYGPGQTGKTLLVNALYSQSRITFSSRKKDLTATNAKDAKKGMSYRFAPPTRQFLNIVLGFRASLGSGGELQIEGRSHPCVFRGKAVLMSSHSCARRVSQLVPETPT
jgi:hypothetical protein